jgi:hypothetical protein
MLNVPLCIQNFYIVSTERESNVRSGRVLITPDRHLPQRTGFGQCVGPQLNLANSPASDRRSTRCVGSRHMGRGENQAHIHRRPGWLNLPALVEAVRAAWIEQR